MSKVGILGLIGKERPQGSGLSKLFAEDTAVEQAVAGMAGAKMVAGRGNGGLSTSGAGPGGGGTGYGHIYGAGNLDTGGRGTHGKGRGPKLAERGEKEVSVGMGGGAGDADGSLSKEQINKVVRAHLAGVKYCYEKELQHKTGLSGGVDIFWVIQPDGAVSRASVKSTTLGDAAPRAASSARSNSGNSRKRPARRSWGATPSSSREGPDMRDSHTTFSLVLLTLAGRDDVARLQRHQRAAVLQRPDAAARAAGHREGAAHHERRLAALPRAQRRREKGAVR